MRTNISISMWPKINSQLERSTFNVIIFVFYKGRVGQGVGWGLGGYTDWNGNTLFLLFPKETIVVITFDLNSVKNGAKKWCWPFLNITVGFYVRFSLLPSPARSLKMFCMLGRSVFSSRDCGNLSNVENLLSY